jgi:hypothetical protein
MPDTNPRHSSRHLRLLVRATLQIPISASPPLGHAEDWGGWARAHIRKERECIGHPGPSSGEAAQGRGEERLRDRAGASGQAK